MEALPALSSASAAVSLSSSRVVEASSSAAVWSGLISVMSSFKLLKTELLMCRAVGRRGLGSSLGDGGKGTSWGSGAPLESAGNTGVDTGTTSIISSSCSSSTSSSASS